MPVYIYQQKIEHLETGIAYQWIKVRTPDREEITNFLSFIENVFLACFS